MRKSIKRLAVLVASAGAVGSGAAYAQDTAAQGAGAAADDHEIIVTAQRRSESVNAIPMSITAVSGDQLAEVGIRTVADLTKIVPGFQFAQGDYGAPVYTLRGIGFNDNSLSSRPAVALSIDEAPLPFPVMAIGVTLDVARVEVLKGPQGTLYGQNATGGAVNYVTAKPTSELSAGVNLEYGRFNAKHADIFVSAPITDTLGIRVAASVDHSDGWQKSYTRDATNGRQRLFVGRIITHWEPSSAFKATLSVTRAVDQSETTAAQLIAIRPLGANPMPAVLNYPRAPADGRAADWDPGRSLKQNNRLFQALLRMDLSLSDAITLTSVSSYSKFHLYRPVDFDGMSYDDGYQLGFGNARVLSQELRLAGSMGGVRWVVGGNFEDDKLFEDSYYSLFDNPVGNSLLPFGGRFDDGKLLTNQRTKTYAVFGNVDADIGELITVHGGIRYTKSEIHNESCARDGDNGVQSAIYTNFTNFLRSLSGLPAAPAIPPGGCITVSSGADVRSSLAIADLNQDNVSWRVGVDFKPANGTLIYANVSKGYKSGGFPTLPAATTDQVLPAVQESVLAYEIGFKTRVSNLAQINAAVFYYDYRDKQLKGKLVVPIYGPLDALVNVPKSSVKGAEFQVNLYPTKGLRITAGGTYIETEIKDNYVGYSGLGVLQNLGGDGFLLTPKWQFSGDAQYDFPLGDTFSGFIGGSVSYQSGQYGGLGEENLLYIDGYALVDARAGIKGSEGRWTASVWGRNITNKYYWTNASYHNNTVARIAGRPATYGVSFSIKY